MNKYPDFTNYGYQISQELGRNLQGGRVTYLAKSLTSNQQVIIKEFRFAFADGSSSAFKAYQREISVLQQLKHPQIPGYVDSFETESGFGLVTEYIDAPCLTERYIFTPQEVKQIAISVLEVLRYLQNFQPPIIHRDIKPENILVDENLQVYLVDFGLAKLRSGELALSSIAAGTPGFMPPEEMFNRPLTTASDLYSLGATLICLLTGTRSVEVDKLLDEDYRFKFEDLVPNLDWRFGKWLTKMVEPHPKRRYENAVLTLQELKGVPVVRGEEIFAFQKDEVEVDGKFVDREIPVVGAREIFAFPEDEVEVDRQFVGVADKGEIVANSRGEIKENKKVFGVVDRGEIFVIGRGILKDKKKFVGALGITVIVSFFAGKSIISLGSSLTNINLGNQAQVNRNFSQIERIQSTRECTWCDLKNLNLENLNLEGVNLEYADLKGANLKNTNLKYANLKNAILEDANLEGANLEHTNLEHTQLVSANLKGANLDNANLTATYFLNANLENTNLKNTNIIKSIIKGTSINEKTILTPKVRLVWQIVNNKYHGLNLKNSNLSDAFLVRGNLENIDLEGANLEKSVITDTIVSSANLKNTNLENAFFRDANLENTKLQGANLQHTRFAAKVNLQKANLEDANLANADFNINYPETNIDLEEANLKNANLENANLTGVNLKNADLTGANIKGADFTGANLEGATMPDGSIYNGKIDK